MFTELLQYIQDTDSHYSTPIIRKSHGLSITAVRCSDLSRQLNPSCILLQISPCCRLDSRQSSYQCAGSVSRQAAEYILVKVGCDLSGQLLCLVDHILYTF